MPDGRPLSLALLEGPLLRNQERRPRKGRRSGHKNKWSSSCSSMKATVSTQRPLTAAETAELDALSKVGQRRQRRWLNDRLLRDMVGALTVEDIEGLFKPVPFGDPRPPSLWTQVSSPDVASLWDLFRSIDMEKESRILAKWKAHVEGLEDHILQNKKEDEPSLAALEAWSNVHINGRRALKNGSKSYIEATEEALYAFLMSQDLECVVRGTENGFQRLIVHSLAQYHGVNSYSKQECDGSKHVVLKKKGGEAMGDCARIPCGVLLGVLADHNSLSRQTLRQEMHQHNVAPFLIRATG